MLIYAAVRPESRCLTTDVAAVFGISRHHVVKVVNELPASRVPRHDPRAQRRLCWRHRLTASVSARWSAHRRQNDARGCFDRDTNTCPLARACGLKGVLTEAFDAFLSVLDRYSLADLIAEPQWVARVTSSGPECRDNHV